MLLDGHHFRVIALNDRHIAEAWRDTVLVPADGSATLAFDAGDAGRWRSHCHSLNVARGMMTEHIDARAA